MELALGTVQFGLAYGVAGGSGSLRDVEIRRILEIAFHRGVSILDTAPLYGSIELRLDMLCEGLEFRINSKIPPIPKDSVSAANWAVESARSSRQRLGRKLKGLLFHRAEDLNDERGSDAWNAVHDWAKGEGVSLGVSVYDPELIPPLCGKFAISAVQLPGNAFDQRHCGVLKSLHAKPTVQLRSAFLQGLLLMPVDVAVQRVPAAAGALHQWRQWLRDRSLSPLKGALSVVKGFEDADACVLGVDSASHLSEILDVWDQVRPLSADNLTCTDARVIDPRLWKDWRQ